MPNNSFPFPTYSGLLEPKHYKNIGNAIWLFLWCISSTTKEVERDGVMWGIVLGNKPIKLSELSEKFGVTERTIRKWLEVLEEHDYIKVTRSAYGQILTVRKSKKFKKRVEQNFHSDEQRPEEKFHSGDREWNEISERVEEKFHSNKDITRINNTTITTTEPDQIIQLATEVEKYFCMKRGKGFNVSSADFEKIKQMMATGIPLEVVKESLDKTFAEYKKKHAWDEIRNMSYCIPRCFDEWERSKVDKSITGAVPHVPVALGSTFQQRPSKQQRELDELRRKLEEEQRREQNRSD